MIISLHHSISVSVSISISLFPLPHSLILSLCSLPLFVCVGGYEFLCVHVDIRGDRYLPEVFF